MKKRTVKQLLLLLGAGIIGAGLSWLLLWAIHPQRSVERFYRHLAGHRYEKAYAMLELPESPFLTKEVFAQIMELNPAMTKGTHQYAGERMEEENAGKRKKIYRCAVYSADEESGAEGLYSFDVMDGPEIPFLGRHLRPLDMVLQDLEVESRPGEIISFDGIRLDEKNTQVKELERLKIRRYVLPLCFAGVHQLEVAFYDQVFQPFTQRAEAWYDGAYIGLDTPEITAETKVRLCTDMYVFWSHVMSWGSNRRKLHMLREDIPNYQNIRAEMEETIENNWQGWRAYVGAAGVTGIGAAGSVSREEKLYDKIIDYLDQKFLPGDGRNGKLMYIDKLTRADGLDWGSMEGRSAEVVDAFYMEGDYHIRLSTEESSIYTGAGHQRWRKKEEEGAGSGSLKWITRGEWRDLELERKERWTMEFIYAQGKWFLEDVNYECLQEKELKNEVSKEGR